MLQDQGKESNDLIAPGCVKIFYASRTHSQLTQFADEIRRVRPSTPEEGKIKLGENNQNSSAGNVKYLTLGSRKNLCIYPKVAKLSSNTAINEKCLDIQSANTPKEARCPFVPSKENDALVERFGDHVMADVRDIEDLGNLGKKIGICPYYASRSVIKSSEVSMYHLFPSPGLSPLPFSYGAHPLAYIASSFFRRLSLWSGGLGRMDVLVLFSILLKS